MWLATHAAYVFRRPYFPNGKERVRRLGDTPYLGFVQGMWRSRAFQTASIPSPARAQGREFA
ncbi:hypothetical protein [Kingella potus]|uniref:hypothetical protein n=1 Tax=Kingella potus TaxID=265175 RepID=UPI001FD19A53|nr:hypothetical protein [Kingella potus]UOP00039.1 hypothetical protein LVJ84_08510 [Kingella potus]